MNIERIMRNVSLFKNLKMDIVLFEAQYPVLFTCLNNEDVYLFSCCLVNSQIVKWIGTKTNYNILIELLTDKITIRDAFLKVTNEIIVVEFDGKNVKEEILQQDLVESELLPSEGEYMDVEPDEYTEEISIFESRNKTHEYEVIKQRRLYSNFKVINRKVPLPKTYYNFDYITNCNMQFGFSNALSQNIVYA